MPYKSNLVQIKSKSSDKKRNKNIRILTINTQSISNKDILLHNHLFDNDMDICIASKTWLMDTTQDETWIKMSTLENWGYNINIANRKERSGWGLALVTKNKYEVKMVDKGEIYPSNMHYRGLQFTK